MRDFLTLRMNLNKETKVPPLSGKLGSTAWLLGMQSSQLRTKECGDLDILFTLFNLSLEIIFNLNMSDIDEDFPSQENDETEEVKFDQYFKMENAHDEESEEDFSVHSESLNKN